MSVDPSPHRERKRRRRGNVAGGRSHRHVVRVDDVEAGRLAVLAEQQRVSVPRLLVESALAFAEAGAIADRAATIETLFSLRRQLAGIANNVNQLAHYANDTGVVGEELSDTLAEVRFCVDQVNETLEAMRR